MAGGGFIGHMVASLKSNKRNRISTFDKIKKLKKARKGELHFDKKASPIDLKKIKKRVQKENDAIFTRKVIFLVICICILLILLSNYNF